MSRTGLTICSTPQATAAMGQAALPRQPDWVLVSQHPSHKRAIVDLCSVVCRPSDMYPDKLLAAALRNQQRYLPLLEALSFNSDRG